jgi:hypothetical protein
MNEPLRTPSADPPNRTELARLVAQRRVQLGAIIVAAVVVGVIAWLVVSRDNSSKPSSATVAPIAPVALSASGLATLAGTVRQPIYWAGSKEGYLYELRRSTDGTVDIRYLPPGVNAGAPDAKYLAVATYPFPGAFAALKNVTDGRLVSIPGGGIALIASTYKKSVHIAYPNVNYQMEVYDPTPGRALAVARSGAVQPVVG